MAALLNNVLVRIPWSLDNRYFEALIKSWIEQYIKKQYYMYKKQRFILVNKNKRLQFNDSIFNLL